MKRKKNRLGLWRFLFWVYVLVMLWLLFDRPSAFDSQLPYWKLLRQNCNLTPGYTISNYLYVVIHRSNDDVLLHCIINLLGNVILFIPAGLLMPKLWPKQRNFFRFFFTCTGAILLVETVQLLSLLGSFDVDDLILNLFGMLLGFILYHLKHPKKK